MQFIKNGPDIPERLLQAHEDGRVVFFCGAGVSYPAGLPGFGGLVKQIYVGLGEQPSAVEQAAIKNSQYDTALGLLEGRIVGGRQVVREQLANILTPDLSIPQATATHEAVLTLAKNRDGRHRLITTNFDRLFEEAMARSRLSLPIFRAPLLPVPKNRWDGVIYLHGLLIAAPTSSDLDRLVVSSGDFGLAYLVERWAARFVSELFRNYRVCFVGYSINDPVLRYMMDALAADRLLGESPAEAFAFGGHTKGREVEAANEWKAKNVTPILYHDFRKHSYLHRTLQEWADTYREGGLGKERIIVQYAMAKPLSSTIQDDFVGRVLWALSDRLARPAKRFADLNPPPPLDWLDPLTDTRFRHEDLTRFGVQPDIKADSSLTFSLAFRPTPYSLAPWMALVTSGHTLAVPWDRVMFEVARWLTRHVADPKVLLWVAKRGGMLHVQFSRLITKEIQEHPPSLPMQTLWRLVLSGRLRRSFSHFDLYDWRARMRSGGLSAALRLELRELLTPCVRLSEPFRDGAGNEQGQGNDPPSIKALVNWDVVLGTDKLQALLKVLATDLQWKDALPELLFDATNLLRDTLDLLRELGGADDQHDGSYWRQPSISDHTQNRGSRDDWTALVVLAREAWLATAARFPDRSRLEVERWRSIPYPLFQRMSFFAVVHSNLFTPEQALGWLLSDNHWWLWSLETMRETLRLLVTIAPRLSAPDRQVLEEAILQGPSSSVFRTDINAERLQQTIDREIWFRLAKFSSTGTPLSALAATRLRTLSEQYSDWQLANDQRDEFPIWVGGTEDWREFLATPKRCRELMSWLREHPRSDSWREDDWGERCKRDFRRTVIVLVHLARRDEWLEDRWHDALQAWADEILAARSWRCVGGVLALMPESVATELARPLGWWLESIAKHFNGNEDSFFALILKILEIHRKEGIRDDIDPVSNAINHPIGHVTEAALRWWYRQSLQDGQGLPNALKPIFTDLCSNVESFRHGRVLLATHVIALFRVDREWTTQCVLPLFDWERSLVEARAAWRGFLWAPRLYWPLMEAIKPQFLATALQYQDLGEHGEQYAALLTFAALGPGSIFSRAELTAATRSLPVRGLERAAEALANALESSGDHRVEYWRNRVLPYLKFIWPKSLHNVRTISESLGRLCIAANESFPEAYHELSHWLQPLQYPDILVHLLNEAGLCGHSPETALAFLDAVIGDNLQSLPMDLKSCLDAIRTTQPELETDNRFQRLHGVSG